MSSNNEKELAEALFGEAQDALFLFDPVTDRVVDANPAARRLTGYSLDELLEMEATELFYFEEQSGQQRLRQAANRTGIFHSQEGYLLRTKDSSSAVPVNITMTRLHVAPKTLGMIAARDVREQRQAHLRLKNVEAELRRVLASVSDCLWSASVDSTGQWAYRYYSPVVEKITGRPSKFFMVGPKRWLSIIHADDQPRWKQVFARLKGITSSQEEYRIIRANGAMRWVRDSIMVTRSAEGKSVRLDGVITDVTDRKETEEALEQERYLSHTLMENIPDFIYFKDREGRFLRINDALAKHLGLQQPALAVGRTDFDFLSAEQARHFQADEQEVIGSGLPLVGKEEKQQWPDGRDSWISTTKMPLRDQAGQTIGTFGISRDITKRMLAEKALAQQERRYRQVTEASLDAIIVADASGRINLFNPAAERVFGYAAAEILGRPLSLLIPPRYHERYEQGWQHYLAERSGQLIGRTVEMHGLRKEGAEFPLEISLSAIELDESPQFLGTIRDLTERNRLRALLLQSEKLASIGLLSAGIAHEINNPLAYVTNNLVVLERDVMGTLEILNLYENLNDRLAVLDPPTFQAVQGLAEKIDLHYVRANLGRLLAQTRDGVQRVTRIVHSMRGLARTSRPELEDVALADLVDSSLEMIRGRLKRDGIVVETDYHVTRLRCVPNQLGQVFLNLLVNALQAIEGTGRSEGGLIRVGSHRENDHLLIEISDNGGGIKPENLPHLFDPFFTTKPVGEGTGLGLSITHGIISGHGGRIEVDSRYGEGTCFRIFLPVDPPVAATLAD